MPTFHVTSPDGQTYEVNAPEGASEQDAISYVQTNMAQPQNDFASQAAAMDPVDLSIARAKNDDFGDYLRKEASAPKPGETPEQTFKRQYGSLSGDESPGVAEGATRGYVQGATMGGGDEIVAGGAALANRIAGKDDKPIGELYDAYLARERQKMAQFRDSHPVAAYGSEIVGAIPTALLPILNGPRAASLAGRLATAAGTGAGQGALYGFNSGEGGAGDRAGNAVVPALIGGGAGALAVPVAAGASKLVQNLLEKRFASQIGMTKPTYDILSRAMELDGSLTGQGAKNIQAAGPDAMLADSGPNARAILDTAIQRSGPAGNVAREAIDTRAEQAGQQINDALNTALGKPGESQSRAVVVYGDKNNPLDLIYKRAYAKPIDYASEEGMSIENNYLKRVPPEAIREANKLMRVEGVAPNNQIIAKVADDGTVSFDTLPDVRQIDYITRGLMDVADKENGLGKLGGTTQTGRAYAKLSRELRGSLKNAVPEYRDALNAAGGLIRENKAKEFGSIVLSPKTTRDDVTDMVSDMGDAELRKVGQGLRQNIDDALANVKRAMTDTNVDAREAVKAVKDLSSRASREKVAAILGEDQAAKLFDDMDRASMALDLRASVSQNSKTFARTALNDSVNAQTEDGAINALRSGRPVNAAQRLTQTLLGRSPGAKEKIADNTYSELVRLLTGPRGADASKVVVGMQKIPGLTQPQASSARNLAELLLRRNAAVTAPTTENIRAR